MPLEHITVRISIARQPEPCLLVQIALAFLNRDCFHYRFFFALCRGDAYASGVEIRLSTLSDGLCVIRAAVIRQFPPLVIPPEIYSCPRKPFCNGFNAAEFFEGEFNQNEPLFNSHVYW